MINNPLDDIVNCNIDISSPASNDATFDSILLVVKGPEASGEKTMSRTTVISQADELLDYGFTTEDAAYIAATVAFSQNPAPDSLYICIRKETPQEEVEEEASEPVYEDIKITLARAKGKHPFMASTLRSLEMKQTSKGLCRGWRRMRRFSVSSTPILINAR